jgi:hypothetical protein
MKFSLFTLLRLAFVGCAYFLFVSCSKDADLLSDYLVTDTDDISQTYALLVNDTYFLDMNTSVVLDVLSNDNVTNLENVTIVETSTPTFGSVVINEDNTLTYVPNIPSPAATETSAAEPETPTTAEEITDTFVYTAEETNDNGVVTAAEATVTVSNSQNKAPTTGDNVFYVTTNGKSTNSGKTESTAWDIVHAFKAAKAGDYIHIKAGNYGNKNLIVQNSGTASQPIRFIGYKNAPGDVISFEGSTFTYGDNVDDSKMPLLQGARINSEGKGEGIVIPKDNIEISNLHIRYFEKGLLSTGDNNKFVNIVASDIGDFNPANTEEASGNTFLNYKGVGITLFGNNVVLKNSIVINAGAEGIHVKRGTNQVHSYNSVYGDNSTNPCDYYYLFSADSHYNTIDHAYVYRKKGLSHYGHGLVCKGDASNNEFTNFEIINTILELSFKEIHDNLFENGSITGSYNPAVRYKDITGGILVANGAHHNTLKNIKISNSEAIISFADWVDGTDASLDANNAGHNNTFINIQGEMATIAVNFDEFSKMEGLAHDNLFRECSFKNIDRLFQVNRPNSNNKFERCRFEDMDKFQSTSSGYDYLLNPNTTFSNSTTINVNFTLP